MACLVGFLWPLAFPSPSLFPAFSFSMAFLVAIKAFDISLVFVFFLLCLSAESFITEILAHAHLLDTFIIFIGE